MPEKHWKIMERKIAEFFGTVRTALSGSNSKVTRSDTLHERLFIEAKTRKQHSVVGLWRNTKMLAEKESKIPVVCLTEKGKHGFWIVCHSSDLTAIANQRVKAEAQFMDFLEVH